MGEREDFTSNSINTNTPGFGSWGGGNFDGYGSVNYTDGINNSNPGWGGWGDGSNPSSDWGSGMFNSAPPLGRVGNTFNRTYSRSGRRGNARMGRGGAPTGHWPQSKPQVFDNPKIETPTPPDHMSKSDMADKMEPMHCHFCEVEMTSPIQAKLHYEGARHRKFVEKWNEENPSNKIDLKFSQDAWKEAPGAAQLASLTSVVSAVKSAAATAEAVTANKTDATSSEGLTSESNVAAVTDQNSTSNHGKDRYCSLCQAPFTSKAQADMHYAGKNHAKKMRLAQGGPPKSNRAGFGSQPLFCEPCQVYASSKDQMDVHLAGKKHLAKAQQMTRFSRGELLGKNSHGGFSWSPSSSQIQGPKAGGGAMKSGFIAGGLLNSTKNKLEMPASTVDGIDMVSPVKKLKVEGSSVTAGINLNDYRTPSGSYYCGTCNQFANSEQQFQVHVSSKRHNSLVQTQGQKPL